MKRHSIALNLALAISAFGLASALPAMAQTPPILKLADNLGNVVTIDSTGAVTPAGSGAATISAGAFVSWSGTLGNFQVQATGQYPSLDVAVIARNNGAAPGTITATFTATYASLGSPAPGSYVMENTPGPGFSGVGSATYSYYIDNTNTAFGMGTLVGILGNVTIPPGITPAWSVTTTGAFSVTVVEVFTLGAGAQVNDDAPVNLFLGAASNPLTVGCPLSSGVANTLYGPSGISASGGTPTYTYSVTSGSLPAGLTLNPGTGAVTGTPTVPGTYSYVIQVVDSAPYPAYATSVCGFTIGMGGAGGQTTPLTLACPSSSATQGAAYSSSFVAAGGTSPYMFTLVAGSTLPYPLKFNPTSGAVTGTPKVSGTFSFTGKVTDSTSGTPLTATSPTCTMTIAPKPTPLALTCASSSGTVGTPYSSAVVASGGTKPYASYKLTSGKLPPGLTLNATTGAITGSPTTAGTYSYTIQVVDANGAITTDGSGSGRCSTSGCSITIKAPPPLSLKCPTGTAKVGTAYTSAATAAGGTAPYTFTITKGALPPGLTLIATTGAITGTPTTPGTSNFTINVKDSSGATNGTQNCGGGCSIVVAPAITISCPPGTATKGTAYSASLTVTGGTAPYTFSITSGSLPAGVTLTTTGANAGKISGTPTVSGTFSVSFKVVDSKGLVGVTSCNNSSCNTSDGSGWSGNGYGGQGWGGDDNSNDNSNCVAVITVCEPGQGSYNWGGGW